MLGLYWILFAAWLFTEKMKEFHGGGIKDLWVEILNVPERSP